MNGAVISIHARNVIPLTARAQAKDDAIHNPSSIDAFAPGVFRRIDSIQKWFDALPQFIRHFPQRGHAWFASDHVRPLTEGWGRLSYQIVF